MTPGDGEGLVRVERTGAVATVTLDHAPVSTMSNALLSEFENRLLGLREAADVRAIGLAAGTTFDGGASCPSSCG